MSLYLDASVLVAALTREPRSEEARALITGRPALDIGFSSWTLTEAMSGLAKKVRTGALTAAEFDQVAQQLKLFPNSHSRTPVTEDHFLLATRFITSRQISIRAGDALHLAIAADFGLDLATFDAELSAAAKAYGVGLAIMP